jgi:hypothetical protein
MSTRRSTRSSRAAAKRSEPAVAEEEPTPQKVSTMEEEKLAVSSKTFIGRNEGNLLDVYTVK